MKALARLGRAIIGRFEGRCKDCKWWREQDLLVNEHAKCCELTKSEDGNGKCNSKAVAMDGEQYHAQLWTGPDFGCSQFKEKSSF